jgi:hypothetical protein
MTQNPVRPKQELGLITMEVVDWDGPIIEIRFQQPITSTAAADELVRQARSFVEAHIARRGDGKAYFVTCYEGFSVSRESAQRLQDGFVDFNAQYSKGDVRYGGSLVAQTLIISTAIRSESRSELYATREEALDHLREQIRRGA